MTIETHMQEGPPHSWEKSWDENVTEAFIEFAQWQATHRSWKKSFRKQGAHDWRRLWSKYSVTQVWTQTIWIHYNSFHLFVQFLWICYLFACFCDLYSVVVLLDSFFFFFKSNLKWGATLNSKSSSNGRGKWWGWGDERSGGYKCEVATQLLPHLFLLHLKKEKLLCKWMQC